MTVKVCSVDGCLARHSARGFYRLHYKRVVKFGTTDLPVPAYAKECSTDECARLVGKRGARGLCYLHYGRLLRVGSVVLHAASERMNERACSVQDCDQPARKMELCAGHYAHKRRHGDENAPYSYRWATERVCVVCGVHDWPQNGFRSVCGPNCRARLARLTSPARPEATRRWRETKYQTVTACARCGDPIDLMEKGRAGRKRRADTKICTPCRRARYTRHKVSVSVLAHRDGTNCGICGDAIDMALRAPDLFRASVDHVIPWAKGGPRDIGNLQLAHLWCNQAKSDQLGFSLMLEPAG